MHHKLPSKCIRPINNIHKNIKNSLSDSSIPSIRLFTCIASFNDREYYKIKAGYLWRILMDSSTRTQGIQKEHLDTRSGKILPRTDIHQGLNYMDRVEAGSCFSHTIA